MKNKFLLLTSFVLAFGLLMSCSSDDNDPITDDDDGGPGEEMVILTGDIATQTLTKDKKYLLKGQVFVRNNQVLTIDPGTVVFGDKATKGTLIIDRGGKIMAEGTASEPIIMTSALAPGSRDRGDWGGLVILGRAPVNQPDPQIEGITPAVTFGGN